MKATRQLHDLGQSLWVDNITRDMLDTGTLERYMNEMSVTGLTSNPSTFHKAIEGGDSYDDAIAAMTLRGKEGEALFFELALDDLGRAADLFMPVYDETGGMDGWVSLELSPLIAYDAGAQADMAARLHASGARPNLFIKIPGTAQGLPAIEEAIFQGIPVNVTLLFSVGQYRAAADAYMRGVERRVAAGLDPDVRSVASLFISRWDAAVNDHVPGDLRNRLGLAVAQRAYIAYREMQASPRWEKLAVAGAGLQRLLWASTGAKDPDLPDTFYVEALAAANTINTMPEATLLAFARHGRPGSAMSADGAAADAVLSDFEAAGVHLDALAARLQKEGAEAFAKSWRALLACIESKGAGLNDAPPGASRGHADGNANGADRHE